MSSLVNPAARPQTSSPASPAPEDQGRPYGRIFLVAGLVLLAAGVWAYFQFRSRSQAVAAPTYRTFRVTRGDLPRTIRVSGQTTARDFATILAPLLRGPESDRNLILMKMAKSGSFVRKGELLAQLDAQPLVDHIDDMADTVRQAEADVRKRAAEQAVELDQLVQTSRVTKADLDKSTWDVKATDIRTSIDQQLLKLAVEENTARYKESLANLENKKASQRAELRILEITSLRQRRHRARHENDLKRFTILSPMDGLVVLTSIWRGAEAAQVQEGDQISPGQTFMKVVNTNNMQVEATVNQSESGQFRIGQTAAISLDAFPGVTLKGHVYSIGALAVGGPRQNFYIRNVPIRIKIDGSDPRLIPDLSAAANVEIQRVKDVVVCRRGAVQREGDKFYVMVKDGQRFVRRDVKLGLANDTEVVVEEGLSAGDEVRTGYVAGVS